VGIRKVEEPTLFSFHRRYSMLVSVSTSEGVEMTFRAQDVRLVEKIQGRTHPEECRIRLDFSNYPLTLTEKYTDVLEAIKRASIGENIVLQDGDIRGEKIIDRLEEGVS
jgi:hypothetical protein